MKKDPIARFGESLARLDEEIDWEVIARTVCHGDAEGFFSEERREAILDAGLKHAADVGTALEALEGPSRSLYIGAAVAELAPILFESIVLERTVRWVTLPGPEATELTRAFRTVDQRLPLPHTKGWSGAEFGPVSHVWMASVLTDPEAFPALHNELYGRIGTKESVRGGHPKAERRAARDLVDRALDAMAAPRALLTTSAEEIPVIVAAVEERGWRLDVERRGRLSGLVGDVLHQARVSR